MNSGKISASLSRALALSNEMLDAAEKSDLKCLESLDLKRRELLKFFRDGTEQVAVADQALLQQISDVNDRTIGLLEHQRRSKGRDLDMAAVGRRAVAAYSSIRAQR